MKIVNYAELPNPMRFVGNSICFFITALTLTVSFNIDAQVNSSLLLNYNKNSSCDIYFPEDSGIINVKNHGVAGNGLQDDTQAIQALFDAYAGLNQIFYFPNGVYLISSGLELKGNFGFDNIQGQCTDSTIIRLADGTFTNNQNPLPVLRTKILGSADVFSNEIRNITINVGVNNPGATGLFFMSNNTGTIQDVKIISEDGQGHRGLDMSTALNGPCLVKNVLVQGFDTGILSGGDAVNSIVYENITVINQNVFGIHNVQQVVTFRNVLSQQNNDIPAFVNGNNKNLAQHWFGQMNVINADLQYTGTGSGSHSTLAVGNCYFNNVTSSGYDNAAVVMYGNFTGLPDQIYQGPDFTEWTHTFNNVASEGKFRLFEDSEMFSLGLEVAEIPSVTWDDLDNWLNVLNYASGNGLTDDTEAIQNAINSMKPGGGELW